MAEDVMQEHKTWPRCWDYIYAKARKAPRKDNCATIEDRVVFEWAEDYYHAEFSKKNDWAKTKKEKETDDALVGASVAGAMKSAGFDKKSRSAKKTKKAEQTTEGSEPPKAEKPKKAAKAEKKEKAPKAPDRDAPDKKESKEKKKPKKDKQIEGQMSLEDLFGGF